MKKVKKELFQSEEQKRDEAQDEFDDIEELD